MNPGNDDRRILAATLTPLVALFVVAACFFAAAPPAATPVHSAAWLDSVRPSAAFPMLSRDRESLLVKLIVLSVPLTLLVVYILRLTLRRLPSRAILILSAATQIALAALLIAAMVSRAAPQPGVTYDFFNWGTSRLLTALEAIVAALLLYRLPAVRRLAPHNRVAQAILAALILAYILLPIFQLPASVKDRYDAAYTVNDLLAPANGMHALDDYVTRYAALLGEPLVPVIALHAQPDVAASLYVQLLAMGLLLCCFFILRMAGLSPLLALAGVALAFTFTIVTTPIARVVDGTKLYLYGSAFDFWQLTPVRLFGPFAIGTLTVALSARWSIVRAFLLGCAVALFAINDPTFGLAAAGVSFLTVAAVALPEALSSRGAGATLKAVATILAGVVMATVVLVVVSLIAFGSPPNFAALTTTGRLYATGALMYPLQSLWGIQVAVLLTFLLTLAWATAFDASNGAMRAALTFCGTFGLVSLIYYLNRPLPSTLQGGSFFLWGLCVVLLVVAIDRTRRSAGAHATIVEAAVVIIAVMVGLQCTFAWSLPNEVLRIAKGLQPRPNFIMEVDPGTNRGPQTLAFVRAHPASSMMILDHVNGKILALEAGGHDLNPLVSGIAFKEELDHFFVVAAKYDYPPMYVTPDAPREAYERMHELGYELKVPGGLLAIYERPAPSKAPR